MKHIATAVALMICALVGTAHANDPSVCNQMAEITYHSNGKLYSCDLGKRYEQGDRKCNPYNGISFFQNGKITSCVLYEDMNIGGISCGDLGTATFYL